jgi:putative flippase GtrA
VNCQHASSDTSNAPLRGVRFLLVGGFNTVFGYACFVGLQQTLGTRTHYLVVLLIAHVISVLVAFVLYRVMVFQVTGRILGDFWRFWSVYLVALAINVVALPLLVELGGLPVVAAQGLVLIGTVGLSFLAHGRFSFYRPQSPA